MTHGIYIHETTCQKRPTYLKRDLHIWKETHISEKRPTDMKRDSIDWDPHDTRDLCTLKETSRETHISEKRCKKRPTYLKWDLHVWKESLSIEVLMIHGIYIHEKKCQKRPTYLKRDVKRDQKRPTYMKRVYRLRPLWYMGSIYMKRNVKKDPHIWNKTYIYEKRLYCWQHFVRLK